MLSLPIRGRTVFIESTDEFVDIPSQVLEMEHSLLSIHAWEKIWHKPYFSDKEKNAEELMSYIKCMTINRKQLHPLTFNCLSKKDLIQIKDYIDNPMTATTFSKRFEDNQTPRKKETITAEIIYYWMFSAQIPKECEKWHINTLMTLIRVYSIKNNTGNNKKASRNQIMKRNAALNAARRKHLGTTG